MPPLTIANLPRLTGSKLSTLLLSPITRPTTAVVDVRDSDYIGGHILGSVHVTISQLDFTLPELVRTLADKKIVVFHCMLSQQRGPSAALRYVRERERVLGVGRCAIAGDETKEGVQKVCILERGFGGWQESYGEDERLTEGYQKDIWEMGYD